MKNILNKDFFLKTSVILMLALGPNYAFAQSIAAQLKKSGKKGQTLLIAALPIFILAVGYLYKKGDPGAKDRLEGIIKGGILVATAFGWSYFFK